MEKVYRILYDPQTNEYMIGYKEVGSATGINYWHCVRNEWRNVLQSTCNSIDDVVELTEDDYYKPYVWHSGK